MRQTLHLLLPCRVVLKRNSPRVVPLSTLRWYSTPPAPGPDEKDADLLDVWAAFKSNRPRNYFPQASSSNDQAKVEEENATAAKRKADWKRRQTGEVFLDHLIVTIRGGKGGDGCVAFNREKFHPYGPPSGGNGGRGGSVYIKAVDTMYTLAGVAKRIRAENGGHGKGSWRHGRNGTDTVISVPIGTVVRELTDPKYRPPTAEESEIERLRSLGMEDTPEMKRQRELERKWVHYPAYQEENVARDDFQAADAATRREDDTTRKLKAAQRRRQGHLHVDLDKTTVVNADNPGQLVARGGHGGRGNPFFLQAEVRSPKWATRGVEGECVVLELELKMVADVGLVGLPNAGKSTLLQALTNSKAEIASYAFTTLNPQVGTVRLWEGTEQEMEGSRVIEETLVERQRKEEALLTGESFKRNAFHTSHDMSESIRFKIADNPGLIAKASENHGLGHSFLRSIERAPVLIYVIDLSSEAPWDDLRTLKSELEAYKPGLSARARMVLANKADLLQASDEAEREAAKTKLERLQAEAQRLWEEGPRPEERPLLEVIPASAKYTQNMAKVVRRLESYVKEIRSTATV